MPSALPDPPESDAHGAPVPSDLPLECQEASLRFHTDKAGRSGGGLHWRLLAVALIGSAAAWLGLSRPTGPTPDGSPAAAAGEASPAAPAAAILLRADAAAWSGPAPAVGSPLPSGWLRLRAGTIHLQFRGGALLLVSGPAEVRLDSGDSAFLLSGRAGARVPETAHGFRLLGPGLGVAGAGSAFGMMVDGDQAPEVHAFDGSVTVSTAAAGATTRTLAAGSAVRIDETGLEPVPFGPGSFSGVVPPGTPVSGVDAASPGRDRSGTAAPGGPD